MLGSYLGRSTGAGALSIWTHYLNDIEYVDWHDGSYSGPAFKLGSGVTGFQVLDATSKRNLVVVGGECPTVGLAGGYTQGGGHSALSTSFGLGADQTLSFDVVTASGDVVTASQSQNSDLYWALSGGGAGNWGVVLSVTVKAYQDSTVGGGHVAFASQGPNTTVDKFFDAVTQFHAKLPDMLDAGASVIYQMTAQSFAIQPITAFNQTADDVRSILAPFISSLDSLGIPYTTNFTEFHSYYDHYNTYMGPLPYGNLGVDTFSYGGRLIPRSVLTSNTSVSDFGQAIRSISEQGVVVVGNAIDVSSTSEKPKPSNAVFQPWRDAAITLQIGVLLNESASISSQTQGQMAITNDFMPQLERITPGSGAYENEANFRQDNWQSTFFGSNYGQLESIKQHWDPESLFYVLKGVGSDAWSVSDDGRMCRQ